MANCANCGEVNPDTNAFCSKCGKPLTDNGKSASEVALENAQKDFDKDAKVGADKSKLTYVCELCGTINRLESSVCSKCGKPRPRSEYINALRNYKNAQDEAEVILNQKQKEEEVAEMTNESALQAPLQEEKEPKLYRYEEEPTSGAQNKSVVQPFVIVPYVDSNQKLWQYQPKQVFKFEPYSFEEREARYQKSLEVNNGAEPTLDELRRIRDRKQSELNALNNNIDSQIPIEKRQITYQTRTKKVRICAAFSLVFSVLLLIAAFALPVLKSFSEFKGIEIYKFIGNCFAGAGMDIGFKTALEIPYSGGISFVLPIGYAIITIFSLIIIIMSVVRLATGRASTKGFVLPLIAFVISIVVLITLAAFQTGAFDNVADSIADIDYGFWMTAAITFILFVIGLCSPTNNKVSNY